MNSTGQTTAPVTSLDGFHLTTEAHEADRLARAYVDALNTETPQLGSLAAPHFLSYAKAGTRTRTGVLGHHAALRRAFTDLRWEVHENAGVLVEGDLVALRTKLTGTHTGPYAGVEPAGRPISTSVSHLFRVQDGLLSEHWSVTDSFRILTQIGLLPGLGEAYPGGLFPEKDGTPFSPLRGTRPVTTEMSRALARAIYDGTINTGRPEDAGPLREDYIQNNGWTPDGRDNCAQGWAHARQAMPGGQAYPKLVVAERDRSAALAVWDGTGAASGRPVDFMTIDFFRAQDDLLAEHWDTVDYVGLYTGLGMLPEGLPIID